MIGNYNFFERFLHKIVLKNNILSNFLFDIEKYLFLQKEHTNYLSIFITGLARSGSTSLLNSFYNTNKFASLTYKDMPFIIAPNLWNKINFRLNKKYSQRAHNDNIYINYESPEAFEEVFWKKILKEKYILKENLISHNLSEIELNQFKYFINLVLRCKNLNYYVSKNNNNILRIKALSNNLNNALFIVLFRDPINQSNSLLNQHLKFIDLQNKNNFIEDYMNMLGHYEFGNNHKRVKFKENYIHNNFNNLDYWIEIWYKTYSHLFLNYNKKNVYFICYEDLCKNTNIYLKRKLKDFDVFENITFTSMFNKNQFYKKTNGLLEKKSYELYEKMKNI